MPTRFGRFVLSKKFSTLFLVLMPFATFLTGWQTERAISFLIGRSHIWGIPCILMLLLSILSMVYVQPPKGKFKKFTCTVKILTCFLIYDILFILPWYIISLIFPIPEALETIITIGLTLTACILVAVGRKNAGKVVSQKYEIFIDGCKNHCRIALISDLHLGIYVRADHVKKVVQRINAMQPDLVIIAGDILDVDHSILNDPEALLEVTIQLQSLSSKAGTYLTLGNHDPNITNSTFQNFIKDSNIRLLNNEAVELSDFVLAGRTDATNNERKPLQEVLAQIQSNKPVILADHNPQGIVDAQRYGIPLVLCGHTHKGQFFPMDFFTKQADGKHYFYGHETFGTTQAIITSGAGSFWHNVT